MRTLKYRTSIQVFQLDSNCHRTTKPTQTNTHTHTHIQTNNQQIALSKLPETHILTHHCSVFDSAVRHRHPAPLATPAHSVAMVAPVVGRPLTQVAIAEAKRNWPFVFGFGVTFSLVYKLSASLDPEEAHKSKFVNPYGHH
ncbi:hypothetical protein KC19_12G103900 [Ceratodon purpureus]|uniref:Uncharacterized protein n=1 Tax=Ceratodon purpureus TaxID=3225 RepID=A0A8T0G6D0_CERPU|nr:hypothetical protein KC19_12G103900 [Ceratodon purpureus]